MRLLSFIIVLIWSFLSCGTITFEGTSVAHAAGPLQQLSSKHKHHPANAKQRKVGNILAVQTLTRGGRLIKQRPLNYGKVSLSPRKLRKRLSAKSAIVLNCQTEEVIYSHSHDIPGQPASTIKVLTGLIAIDSLNGRDMVQVSRKASRMPRSKIYLRKGKEYVADDLVNAVLLASANDASVALAEKIAGSEAVFAKLMTAKARSFGASNTVCKTASGLTARQQKSTARDLAVIFNKAMDNDYFANKLAKRRIKNSNGSTVYSHNKALWRIKGAVGGKTGYTNKARQTYVGKFERDGVELVVAFLGSETMWEDAKKLVKYGFSKEAELRRMATQKSMNALPVVRLASAKKSSNPLLLTNLR